MERLAQNPIALLIPLVFAVSLTGCLGKTPGPQSPEAENGNLTGTSVAGGALQPDESPPVASPQEPASFAAQAMQTTVTEALAEAPSYRIEAADLIALTEHSDTLTPEELALVRSVAGQ